MRDRIDDIVPLESFYDRREFVRRAGALTAAVGGVLLGVPSRGEERTPPPRRETNIADFMKKPRKRHSIPGHPRIFTEG